MTKNIIQRTINSILGSPNNPDTLHDIDLDYGYPQMLEFRNFLTIYKRFGIAKNVVELPADTGWMDDPIIVASETFVSDLNEIDANVNLYDRLKALDIRQRVGRYAGLFIRVRDNKQPDEPIDTQLAGVDAVMSLIAIFEGNLTVSNVDSDPMSENFGLPTMYQYQSSLQGAAAGQSFRIHPDRIIIASEDADAGGIFGTSALEAPFNSLMDLRKIIGAGGEGFYRNAAQSVVFTLKDGASAKGNEELLGQFNDNYDDFTRNRMRRGLWTPGLEPNALDSNLINPKEFFNNALNDVAAASKIPATILIGQQTGRLASSEDSKQFLSGINSRRENFMSELLRNVLDWFIKFGVLSTDDYEIEWSDLLALSQEERSNNAKALTAMNKDQFSSGQDIPFSTEEIRSQAGFDDIELPASEGETEGEIVNQDKPLLNIVSD